MGFTPVKDVTFFFITVLTFSIVPLWLSELVFFLKVSPLFAVTVRCLRICLFSTVRTLSVSRACIIIAAGICSADYTWADVSGLLLLPPPDPPTSVCCDFCQQKTHGAASCWTSHGCAGIHSLLAMLLDPCKKLLFVTSGISYSGLLQPSAWCHEYSTTITTKWSDCKVRIHVKVRQGHPECLSNDYTLIHWALSSVVVH